MEDRGHIFSTIKAFYLRASAFTTDPNTDLAKEVHGYNFILSTAAIMFASPSQLWTRRGVRKTHVTLPTPLKPILGFCCNFISLSNRSLSTV